MIGATFCSGMSVVAIIDVLRHLRLPLSDEKRLQAEIALALAAAGIDAAREVHLGDGDVIDFMVGCTGVEVKIKGAKRAIYHQLERYAQHEEIVDLLLVTNVPMGFPTTIAGKPVYLLNLAKAWL